LILFHNEKYGTSLKKEDFHSYNFWEVWGGTEEEACCKVLEFYQTKYFDDITPIPGSLDALSVLKEEGLSLFSITGRGSSLKEKTSRYIDHHFPNIFSEIHHANTFGHTSVRLKKSEICKKLGIGIIIEDDLRHITDCADAGIKVLVFDQPWNRVGLPGNAIRVNSWHQILGEILGKDFFKKNNSSTVTDLLGLFFS